jgi:hypothetical protein
LRRVWWHTGVGLGAEWGESTGFALKANIDGRIYDYWRRKQGKDFWKHEMDYMLKRHPEFRVQCRPDNPTVRVDGLKGTALAATPRSSRGGRWAT